jgi:GntP family gluconate:H+ symporter
MTVLLAASAPVAGPFLALAVGVIFVVLAIARWKMHAFFALMLAAMLVGLIVALGGFGKLSLIDAIERPVAELGAAAGKIAFVIAMAAVIGECLTVSGGAERIVTWLLHLFKEQRAGAALLTAGFILGIPVFFDTVFLLLLPLARALAIKTGRDYTFYVMAMCAGAVITHTTVPPTPGPLLVAEALKLDLGLVIVGGFVSGLLPAWGALVVARWINRRQPTMPPAMPGAETTAAGAGPAPALGLALAPVVLPLVLIAFASACTAFKPSWYAGAAAQWINLAGNKHAALLVGMVAALVLALRKRRANDPGLAALLGAPLESAGAIILITSAGGAFGAMLREAGLAGAVTTLAEGRQLNYVLLGWLLSAVIRVAQGSTTVAMITASGMLIAVAGETGWGCHPFWVFLAIGYGGLFCSWMNDSGFWLVSRMCGWSERDTLRSWTLLLSAISVFGLIEALVLSAFF